MIVLEDQIYLYDIQTMKLLYTIQTSPNPNGKRCNPLLPLVDRFLMPDSDLRAITVL